MGQSLHAHYSRFKDGANGGVYYAVLCEPMNKK
jgi:hypothetical protein